MNDAEYRATKARVFKLARKWQTALGLRWWTIEYEWLREAMPIDMDNADWHTTASVAIQWMYLNACVTLCLPEMMTMTDAEIERTLVHEFIHVLVAEMKHPCDDKMEHEERVVTTLTNAAFWIRDNRVEKETKP